jgi:hypothetical protein
MGGRGERTKGSKNQAPEQNSGACISRTRLLAAVNLIDAATTTIKKEPLKRLASSRFISSL